MATSWESPRAGNYTYADRVTSKFIARAEPTVKTRTVTVASGQVLKARTWLESDINGKAVAHGTIAERASTVFAGTLKNGDVVAFAGLTYTASADSTAAEVVAGLLGGAGTYSKGTVVVAVSATYAKWSLSAGATSATIDAISVVYGATVTDLVATVTNTSTTSTLAGTVTTAPQGTATFNKVIGFLSFDVDATSADVEASIYTQGSFYEDALVWKVDTAIDVVVLDDGTEVACTTYDTGADTSLARQKFVEGTNFELVTVKDGEVM